MSDKHINIYEFPESLPDYSELKDIFCSNITKGNTPFFEANCEIENNFRTYCHNKKIKYEYKTVIEYDRYILGGYRYIYLNTVSDDCKCIQTDMFDSFLDISRTCPGGGTYGVCGHNTKQVSNIPVNKKGVAFLNKMGIVRAWNPQSMCIYLISDSVKTILLESKATGVYIADTDTSGCYQLCISAETLGPANIGDVRFRKTCPNCGATKIFLSSSERSFFSSDIGSEDFQVCRFFDSINVGKFEATIGFTIVSQRIFNILLENKIKGITRHITEPYIEHVLVNIIEKGSLTGSRMALR